MSKYTVYILLTSGGTLYTGQTNNLSRRLEKHKNGSGAKYLRMFKSFELVYEESVATLSQALQREREIKKLSRSAKLELVK